MKNKKSIAIAMSAVSTLGAVAPIFADEVSNNITTATKSVDLAIVNGVKSVWGKVGNDFVEMFVDEKYSQDDVVEEQKKIDALKLYLENKAAEKDSNGELKYTIRQTYKAANTVGLITSEGADAGQDRQGYLLITVIDNSDVHAKTEEFKVYGFRRDTGFGQGEPTINGYNTVDINFDTQMFTKFNELTDSVETKKIDKLEDLHKELDKLIYEIRKAGANVTVKVVEGTNKMNLEIYKGNLQLGLIRLDRTDYMNKALLKNIPASNDFVGHWAEDKIVDAMLNDIVDVSKTFRPEDKISRAEFAKIAVKAYGLNENTRGTIKINFSDVAENSWDYNYIMALATRGYIKGFEGKFRPQDEITRQEAAVIIAKLEKATNVSKQAVEVETVTTDKNGNAVHTSVEIKGIEDGTTVANWADESVKMLLERKVIKGYEENGKTYFKPVNNIKRAEALVMMTR